MYQYYFYIFQVGRALGPSILDLTDSNPLSRVQNSEFRSLQGLRISLRNEIEKSFPHSVNHSKVNFCDSIDIFLLIVYLIFFSNLKHANNLNKTFHNLSTIFQRKLIRRIIIRRRKVKN